MAPRSKASASASRKSAAARKTAGKKPAARKIARRADLGAPVDAFFARQPAALREVLEALRRLVAYAAPDAEASLKWGMPFYTVNGTMMCALGAHRSHVNLILSGPPKAYADPEGLLSGEGKSGRHLRLTALEELPREAVRGWLRTAAELARRHR